MARVHGGLFRLGVLGAPLTIGQTTVTFGQDPLLPTVSGGDRLPISLPNPAGAAGGEEIHLTAYTAGSLTGTVERAQEGTTELDHDPGAPWLHGPTPLDIASSAYELAVEDGFVGTLTEWLTSLQGADGSDATVTEAAVVGVLDGATLPTATVVATDLVFVLDGSDSLNLKGVPAGDVGALGGTGGGAEVLDEDDFASDSDTQPPSQQSAAVYIDAAARLIAAEYVVASFVATKAGSVTNADMVLRSGGPATDQTIEAQYVPHDDPLNPVVLDTVTVGAGTTRGDIVPWTQTWTQALRVVRDGNSSITAADELRLVITAGPPERPPSATV